VDELFVHEFFVHDPSLQTAAERAIAESDKNSERLSQGEMIWSKSGLSSTLELR
jgi:hypothetical protein